MTKKCPINAFHDCLEEICAWFGEEVCAIKGLSSIAETLYLIQTTNQVQTADQERNIADEG